MTTISQNVARLLNVLGIQGVQIFDESRPDRVFAWDIERQVIVDCMRHRGQHWHEDATGPELKHFHGASAFASFRENAKPSMQIVFHAISDASPRRNDSYFLEIDIDHAPPTNPVNLLIHGQEVIANAIEHATTNQEDIARRLDERFKGAMTNA